MTKNSYFRARMLDRVIEQLRPEPRAPYEETIVVLPVKTVAEGFQLPDGRVVVVEIAKPAQRFAVVLRSSADDVEIVKVFDKQSEAVAAAEHLAVQLETFSPQGTLQ